MLVSDGPQKPAVIDRPTNALIDSAGRRSLRPEHYLPEQPSPDPVTSTSSAEHVSVIQTAALAQCSLRQQTSFLAAIVIAQQPIKQTLDLNHHTRLWHGECRLWAGEALRRGVGRGL